MLYLSICRLEMKTIYLINDYLYENGHIAKTNAILYQISLLNTQQ